MTCAVSHEWLQRHRTDANPYHDIPVEKLAGIEIVSARLAEMPACLALGDGGDVQAAYRVSVTDADVRSRETFVPETGWRPEETVRQIEVVVYSYVVNESKKRLTDVDRDYLNETLKIYRDDPEDPRNYHVAVESGRQAHPLHDLQIVEELRQRLPQLPVIHFGGEARYPVLLVPEGVLIARIRHFLSLIERHG